MSPAHVLVVDDTPRNVKLLADLLAASGYAVSTAGSGAEALAQVERERIDLVLLDVVMPGMNGYDVCRAIRARPATAMLPVVLITALEASEERIKGLDAGADDFLTRPVSRPELLARVRSLLRIKHLYDTVDDQARQLREWNDRLERRVGEQVDQLERLATLKRFLPPAIAERIVAGSGDDPLRSHRREIVVVALELHGFTAFAEAAAPEEVLEVLREYHEAVGQLVLEHEGTIERFTAEGLTVFFNDPVAQPDAAARALRLAQAIRVCGAALSSRWSRRGVALQPGIGVAQGYATLGAVGLETRSDYTAIGTVTHLASRLAEVARSGEILIAQRVLADAGAAVAAEPTGELVLRGFSRPVVAYRLRADAPPADVVPPSSAPAVRRFVREGELWTLAYGGTSFRLRDSKGLRYLEQLLRHPDRDFHVLDLVALGRGDVAAPAASAVPDGCSPGRVGDAGPALDEAAKAAYRARLVDLRAELVDAEAGGDAGRAALLREELAMLAGQLAAAMGLGGRDRPVGSASERARVSVTRAISEAIKRVREHSRPLGRYLEASIRTGTFCTYRPPDTGGARWDG